MGPPRFRGAGVTRSKGTDGFKQAVSVGKSEPLVREEIEGKRRLYATLAGSVPCGDVDTGLVTMQFRHADSVLRAIHNLLAKWPRTGATSV